MAEASLDLLLVMVQRLLDGQLMLRDDVHDMRSRLTSLERAVLASRRYQASDAEHVAHVQEQMDRLTDRIARIERRLEIAG